MVSPELWESRIVSPELPPADLFQLPERDDNFTYAPSRLCRCSLILCGYPQRALGLPRTQKVPGVRPREALDNSIGPTSFIRHNPRYNEYLEIPWSAADDGGRSMAIKFSCGSCGKKFAAKDEYAGRRTKCPLCGSQVQIPFQAQVPFQTTWEADELLAAVPAPRPPPPLPALGRISIEEEGEKPELWKSKSAKTPSHKNWSLMIAVAIVGLGLTGMSAYAFVRFARSSRSLPATTSVAPIVVNEPTPQEIKEWLPVVKVWEQAHIEVTCESIDTYESSKVLSISVRPVPTDKRKIPWLWESTAVFAVKSKPIGPNNDVFKESYIWKRLFQWTPGGTRGECWREIVDMSGGSRGDRKYFGLSEWKEEFRSMVSTAWLQEFREHEADHSSIQTRMANLAIRFGITMDELREILKATG